MRESFITKRFNPDATDMIVKVNRILKEYAAQGFDLTLRQLYYQMVARNWFPENRRWNLDDGKWVKDPQGTKNAEPNYKWLGGIVNDGRMAGMIDWDMIKDRAREMVCPAHWDTPADIVDAAAASFRIDRWEDQPNYVEVMVEKQALEGVLIPVCRELDVPFTANKGYTSQSAMYEASKRFQAKLDEGKNLYVLYLGDHDPSGIDMTRDVQDRLDLFVSGSAGLGEMDVKRLALNMPQIRRLNPPADPAKLTDSRAKDYVSKFGDTSWELDAIEPATLAGLVRTAVDDLLDQELWEKSGKRQADLRADLKKMAKEYREENE